MSQNPEVSPQNQKDSSQENRPAPKNPPSWFFLLVPLCAVIGAVLWIATRPTPTPDVTPPPVESTPVPTASTPTKTTTTFVLFVPNDNALLSRQTVTDASTPPGAAYPQKAKRALELLFPKLDFLPAKTRLLAAPVKEKNGIVRLNFSREFLRLDKQSETPIMLSLDAMASTLGALDGNAQKAGKPAKLRVLVEGKTVSTLGQFSLDEPWEATQTTPNTLNPEDAV